MHLFSGCFSVATGRFRKAKHSLTIPMTDGIVYSDRLREILKPLGVYRVTVLRQSCNYHAEKIATGIAQDAL